MRQELKIHSGRSKGPRTPNLEAQVNKTTLNLEFISYQSFQKRYRSPEREISQLKLHACIRPSAASNEPFPSKPHELPPNCCPPCQHRTPHRPTATASRPCAPPSPFSNPPSQP